MLIKDISKLVGKSAICMSRTEVDRYTPATASLRSDISASAIKNPQGQLIDQPRLLCQMNNIFNGKITALLLGPAQQRFSAAYLQSLQIKLRLVIKAQFIVVHGLLQCSGPL